MVEGFIYSCQDSFSGYGHVVPAQNCLVRTEFINKGLNSVPTEFNESFASDFNDQAVSFCPGLRMLSERVQEFASPITL